MILGKIIRERRKSLGLTQEDLADMAGIALRTLKQIELEQGNPTWKTVEKLALVLGMEIQITIKTTEG